MNSDIDTRSETLPHALVRASRSVRYAATGALIFLAIFLLAETVATIQGVDGYVTPDTITVTGEGTATAIPDTATVSFGATATAADVAAAQANVTSTINTALASVKASGIAAADITTDSFNVSPHYTSPACSPGILCTNASPTISGYDVSENVTVKIHDTTKVSAILDGLAKANVSNVSGPNFIVDDTQAVESQARAMAIQKAQTDAQALAAQLHVRLGKVESYSDDSDNTNPQPMMASASAGAMAPEAATPSVPVGQNTYTKDVSVTYEIH